MNRYLQIAIVSLSLLGLILVSCSDRGTNVPETPMEDQVEQWAFNPDYDQVYAPDPFDPASPTQLMIQIRNVDAIQEMALYIPSAALTPPIGESKPVPLLVLLPPQYGDKLFYFDRGLLELAQEMIHNGEIQPMVIACLGNDELFGGYFWGNSYPGGMYDEIISNPDSKFGMVPQLWNDIPALIQDPDKCGIGGIGMGAYGAFRAVLKNPGTFTSISVTDGPLDFDGASGNSGLIDLFDDALLEQGLTSATFKNFDSSYATPISNMFIGGAIAFSPNDTLVDYWVEIKAGGTRDSLHIDARYQMSDTLPTLITDVVKEDMGDWDFHLPFDGSGAAFDPIWSLWMENDLEAIYDAAPAGSLDDVNMWIGTTAEAKWGFYDMTQSWISTLNGHGYSPTVYRYTGYEGKPASENQYVYDLMREMLIFHSENFGD